MLIDEHWHQSVLVAGGVLDGVRLAGGGSRPDHPHIDHHEECKADRAALREH